MKEQEQESERLADETERKMVEETETEQVEQPVDNDDAAE